MCSLEVEKELQRSINNYSMQDFKWTYWPSFCTPIYRCSASKWSTMLRPLFLPELAKLSSAFHIIFNQISILFISSLFTDPEFIGKTHTWLKLKAMGGCKVGSFLLKHSEDQLHDPVIYNRSLEAKEFHTIG